jgi:hypothetical protein
MIFLRGSVLSPRQQNFNLDHHLWKEDCLYIHISKLRILWHYFISKARTVANI